MLCQNCKNHEATYHYRTNINGKVTENHLCSECAAKENLSEGFFDDFNSMFEDMYRGFDDFFGSRWLSPSAGFFGTGLLPRLMPRIDVLIDSDAEKAQECKQEKSETQVEAQKDKKDEVNSAMSKRRELNALKCQMKSAIRAEDFEKAAELRDKIHALEKE